MRSTLLFICTLVMRCHTERNPFDMFGMEMINGKEQRDVPITSTEQSKYTTMEHYRELHRLLVRILFLKLNLHPELTTNFEIPLEMNFKITLYKQDITNLIHYCDTNQTLSSRVSPDAINYIFSKSIYPLTIVNVYDFSWITNINVVFVLIIALCSFLVIVSIYWVRNKCFRLLICIVPGLIFVQSFYQKYTGKLAQKMSMLSRYNGPPEDCKPIQQHSWTRVFVRFFSFRPSFDECTEYYEGVLTEPFYATSIYETFLELLFQPLVSGFSAYGKGFGKLYDNLVTYMPLYCVIPIVALSLVMSFVILYMYCSGRLFLYRRSASNLKSKYRAKIKSKPSLTLKDS